MAERGELFQNKITGQTLFFRTTTGESSGELVEVETTYRPHSLEPPAHFHPHQTERFEVLAGQVRVNIAGESRLLRQGNVLEIPAGTIHAMFNPFDEEARLVWQTRPALKTEKFFETAWGLAMDGKVGPKGVPSPLQAALLLWTYREEFRLVKPPVAIQNLLLAPMAAIARCFGGVTHYRPASVPSSHPPRVAAENKVLAGVADRPALE